MELLTTGSLDLSLLGGFAIALLIGALIGVDRERSQQRGTAQFAGLRTFILIAEAGALSAWLSDVLGLPWLVMVGLGVVGLLVAVAYGVEASRAAETPGLTTEVAAVVTYLLGAAVLAGRAEIAVTLAIATSAVLTFRQSLHRAVAALGEDDIVAGLKLLFATFIVLPLLPDTPLDPWGVFVPYKLWWLVVLISTLSLVGYVAVRLLGPRRGLALTGLFGGLVSSTAVTLSFARRSKEDRAHHDALAVGVLLAWSVMAIRVLIEVAVVNPALLAAVWRPIVTLLVVLLLGTVWSWRAGAAQEPGAAAADQTTLRNPFSLTAAIQFGALFAGVLLVVQLARQWLGEGWIVGVAALAGITDVDAITLSVAELSRGTLSPDIAALSILVAALTNTAVKCGLVVSLGTPALGRRVVVVAVVATVASLVVWGVQNAVG